MHRTLLACAALAAAAATSAQTLKPGLWEITNRMQGAAGSKMDAAMAQMQKQMAAMSPEQRKAARETFQGLRKLPPEKQHELRERWLQKQQVQTPRSDPPKAQ